MKYGTMSYLSIKGMVLMIQKFKRKNDPNSDFFTLPGGKLKDSEKTNIFGGLEAAIRETKEESGLTLIDPIFRGTILFDNSDRVFDNWPDPEDFLVYVFSAEKHKGRLKKKTEEGIPLLIDENFIDSLPKNPGDEKIYEWLEDSRYFMGVIKHRGKLLDERGTFVYYFD